VNRTFLGVLLAGLALFVWEFVAHEFLPLGEAGFRAIPNEATVLPAMKDMIREPGLYFFPAPEDRPGMTNAQKQEAMQKAAEKSTTGPAGLMVFHPNGVPFSFPKSLAIQFAGDVIAMAIVAFILSQITMFAGFGQRVVLCAIIGFIPALRTEIPYWNWYNFPSVYTRSQIAIHVVGFILSGLILARMVRGVPK
jgi:hypothetical protein